MWRKLESSSVADGPDSRRAASARLLSVQVDDYSTNSEQQLLLGELPTHAVIQLLQEAADNIRLRRPPL